MRVLIDLTEEAEELSATGSRVVAAALSLSDGVDPETLTGVLSDLLTHAETVMEWVADARRRAAEQGVAA